MVEPRDLLWPVADGEGGCRHEVPRLAEVFPRSQALQSLRVQDECSHVLVWWKSEQWWADRVCLCATGAEVGGEGVEERCSGRVGGFLF